jgi:hypothetical protein
MSGEVRAEGRAEPAPTRPAENATAPGIPLLPPPAPSARSSPERNRRDTAKECCSGRLPVAHACTQRALAGQPRNAKTTTLLRKRDAHRFFDRSLPVCDTAGRFQKLTVHLDVSRLLQRWRSGMRHDFEAGFSFRGASLVLRTAKTGRGSIRNKFQSSVQILVSRCSSLVSRCSSPVSRSRCPMWSEPWWAWECGKKTEGVALGSTGPILLEELRIERMWEM